MHKTDVDCACGAMWSYHLQPDLIEKRLPMRPLITYRFRFKHISG
jgi:hypothetical protein